MKTVLIIKKMLVLLIAFAVSFSSLSCLTLHSAAIEYSIDIGDHRYGCVYFHTTGGLTVEAWDNYDVLTDSRITYYNNWVAENYPNAVKLGEPTRDYNCHTYAWLNRSCPNDLWIDEPDIFLEDPTTIRLDESELQPGDIVVYAGRVVCEDAPEEVEWFANHSAVVENVIDNGDERVIMCSSKWGERGLYYHALEDCPYYMLRANGELNIYIEFYRYEHSAHSVSENHYPESNNDSVCVEVACTECEWEYLIPHTLAYASTDVFTHNAACTRCEWNDVESHTLVYSSIGASTHSVACTKCEWNDVESHALAYSSIDASTHEASCEKCEYQTVPRMHQLHCTDKNGSVHTWSCSVCSYTKNEKHVLDLSGKRCLKCGRTGSFAVNKKEPEELLE